jgi:putative membrane-bound dehydrogenase-like protein
MKMLPGVGFVALLLLPPSGALSETGAEPAADQTPTPTQNSVTFPDSPNAPEGFRIKPGFRLEMVTPESAVSSPIAMAFDENGRLFVAEAIEAQTNRDQSLQPGRIRLLEDTDGDGIFDKNTIYADNLPTPTAVACYSGGIFVAAGGNILYFKDTTGTGSADVRKIVFSGFGGEAGALDPMHAVNSFCWGLDNRIHGSSGGVGGRVTARSAPGSGLVSLTGSDFSFDPRSLTILPEAGPSETGLCFDSIGREFTSDAIHPLRGVAIERRYFARNMFFPKPRELVDIASPATPLFTFGQDTESRQPTGAAVSKVAGIPARAGLSVTNDFFSSWMTNAHGCVIYRGNIFGTNYLENVFICDPSAHVIHREVLRERGLELQAERPKDELNTEFVYSRDSSFRPMHIINGPDGALYVADYYRGGESGRIFRIAPANFKPPRSPQLGKAVIYDVVANLAHTNGWNRETAARLVYERGDAAAIPLLTNMLQNSRLPLARLHALHALDSLGALKEANVLRGLRDKDDRVREHAVKLSERVIKNGAVSDTLWYQLRPLASAASPRVRLQLALTLGELRRPERTPTLVEILRRGLDNIWMRSAVMSSLSEGAGAMFAEAGSDSFIRNSPEGDSFLRQLATMVCVQGQLGEVTRASQFAGQTRFSPEPGLGWLFSMGDSLARSGSSFATVDRQAQLQDFFALSLNMAIYGGGSPPARLDAVRLLGVSPYTYYDLADLLLLMLGSGESQAVQSAAIASYGRFDDPRVASALLGRWQVMSPLSRYNAVAALLRHVTRVGAVLGAVEAGRIRDFDLSSTQINFLRTSHDVEISRRAVQHFGPFTTQRQSVIEQYRPALRLKGFASRGRDIFRARCASCHEMGGVGPATGPDLAGIKVFGKERILTAILEPGNQIQPGYETRVLETRTGEILIGSIAEESLQSVTIRQPDGITSVWPRANIQFIESMPWSVMPDGLEQGLSTQGMADLLEFFLMAP